MNKTLFNLVFALIIFLLYHLIHSIIPDRLSAQHSIKKQAQDTTKLERAKIDTTRKDTLIQISLDTTTVDSSIESFKIDSTVSGDELLEDDYISTPADYDTLNKVRLPVNLKKTKFAYFDATQSIDRVVQNDAFKVGEKLTFIIRYGPVVAGSAIMGIPKIVKHRGVECFKIQTEARSSSFFSVFFKVKDKVISYMDREGLFTWGFEKHLREGSYSADQIVEYDQFNGWAVTNKKDSLQIPPCVQDILTSFYFIRTQPLEVGKSIFLDNHADNKLYPLEIKVHKRERVKVKAGTFDCVIVEPILRASGIFKSKGRLLVWLTDDERKIPVQMKSKIIIGYITAELKEMKGIRK